MMFVPRRSLLVCAATLALLLADRPAAHAAPGDRPALPTSGSPGDATWQQKPGTRPTSQPATRPGTRPTSQPNQQPGTRPGTRPKTQPATRPGTRPTSRPTAQPARSRGPQPVTVPVNIAIGPTFTTIGNIDFDNFRLAGPVYEDQAFHYGLRIDIAAVISREWVRQYGQRLPAQARDYVNRAGEVRYRPGQLALIPSNLHISPGIGNTGVYGATWQLLGVGLAPISNPVRVSLHGALIGTYTYIHSTAFPSPTHFLRPGIDLSIDIELPVTRQFLLSFGAASQLYIPQQIGGPIFSLGEGPESIWHFGQLFVMFHARVPYTTHL